MKNKRKLDIMSGIDESIIDEVENRCAGFMKNKDKIFKRNAMIKRVLVCAAVVALVCTSIIALPLMVKEKNGDSLTDCSSNEKTSDNVVIKNPTAGYRVNLMSANTKGDGIISVKHEINTDVESAGVIYTPNDGLEGFIIGFDYDEKDTIELTAQFGFLNQAVKIKAENIEYYNEKQRNNIYEPLYINGNELASWRLYPLLNEKICFNDGAWIDYIVRNEDEKIIASGSIFIATQNKVQGIDDVDIRLKLFARAGNLVSLSTEMMATVLGEYQYEDLDVPVFEAKDDLNRLHEKAGNAREELFMNYTPNPISQGAAALLNEYPDIGSSYLNVFSGGFTSCGYWERDNDKNLTSYRQDYLDDNDEILESYILYGDGTYEKLK